MANRNAILVDTGPLVAFFSRRDECHAACIEILKTLHAPLVTVWPVITEAMYLLAFSDVAQEGLWQFLLARTLLLLPLEYTDLDRMRELMKRYHDHEMDLADAALVRVAEREKIRTIFTIDQRDFSIYRPAHVHYFHLLPAISKH